MFIDWKTKKTIQAKLIESDNQVPVITVLQTCEIHQLNESNKQTFINIVGSTFFLSQ